MPPSGTAPVVGRPGSSREDGELFNEEEWEAFWKDVRAKAAVARQ
jgi:hypothetical protein